jgi:hypothetical protein
MLFCSTRAQVRHAAPVVFPVDFDGGEYVNQVHPIFGGGSVMVLAEI